MTSEDLFKGKRVVLFALPGAFTPTCSSKHVPGYVEASDEIKSLDVDDVYCLAVNDAFAMRRWGIELGMEEEKIPGEICFKKVKFLPDGNAYFTRGMGMACMFADLGFGERSWRYSVVINDLKVEKIFIEGGGKVKQNPDSDPYEVSDAKTMLEYLKSKKEEEETKVEEETSTSAIETKGAEEAAVPAKDAESDTETPATPVAEEPKVEKETSAKEEEPKVEEETVAKEEELKAEKEASPEEEKPKAEKKKHQLKKKSQKKSK